MVDLYFRLSRTILYANREWLKGMLCAFWRSTTDLVPGDDQLSTLTLGSAVADAEDHRAARRTG